MERPTPAIGVKIVLLICLLTACGSGGSDGSTNSALAAQEVSPTLLPPVTLPAPTSEPTPTITIEQDKGLAAYCHEVGVGDTATAVVGNILQESGNEIGMHTIEDFLPSGWYVADGEKGKEVRWSAQAREALSGHNVVVQEDTLCIGPNEQAVKDRIVPPKPDSRLLPPYGRIFSGLPQGFSPSRKSKQV